ncbi:MAG: PilN domain-containing protein [Methylotenera sp.]|uniref:PilN domain-containing protein n=1 Tax=Methylotenera sp. TaxID=2051956 RepID=UPI00180B5D7D|nr:PilN domain-containing protein [Methylotenera sp.]NOU24170.1 hypothetical protein [Methylotenera sp.]
MNHVRLNHAQSNLHTTKLATALLLLGGLLSTASLVYYQQVATKAERLQEELQQSTQHAKKLKVSSNSSSASQQNNAKQAAKTSEINAAISSILLPWPAIFKALEVATPDEVKLLALEPSSKARNANERGFRVTAVTLNADTMMAYVDVLTQQKLVNNIVLLSQESTELNGQAAIQFVIETVWKT